MISRVLVLVLFFLLFSSLALHVAPGDGWDPVLFRISVENSADHVQTRSVQAFADSLRDATEGRIAATVYHSGTLFRDTDVPAALSREQVEMAVPGTWHLDRYQPDVAVFLLPWFFGREIAYQHRYSDGNLGREINRRIEEELDVVVPGRWFDLGHGHLFLRGRPVTDHGQLAGLIIRVAGGRANELRVESLGADAITIPWGEVPARLARGQMDGLLTTHETVRSGRLWEHGVTHVLEDFQYMPQYIPLIRRSFWNSLSDTDRDLIRTLWEAEVETQRVNAGIAQHEARVLLQEQGVQIFTADSRALTEVRRELLRRQDSIARAVGIDPSILEMLRHGQ